MMNDKSPSLIKTKRTKKSKKKRNLQKLWNKLDKEFNQKEDLELVYNNAKISKREYCELCEGKLYTNEDRFLTCENKACGVIYKDALDESAEWRYYGADDSNSKDPTRCGMPINPLLKESSYGCKVVCNYKSSYEMRKIRRYTEWQSMPYEEKTQYDEFEWIKAMSKINGISKIIVDEALRQHSKISKMRTFRGFNRDGIIAASVYISCRIHGFPRTAKEIATIFKLDNTSATKGCKNAGQIINNIEADCLSSDKTHFCTTTPKAFIERFCSKLNINKELTKLCMFVSMKIQKQDLIPENTPNSVAAGIVFFVAQCCNLNITKQQVHTVSEISEVTINKCHKKLDRYKGQLIPSILIKQYQM